MQDCLFCKIVAGTIPSHKIYEGEHTYAFLDIRPVHIGHTLVVPKNHTEDIFSIEAADWRAVNEVVRKLAPIIKEATGADGVNIIMNNKKSAGQLVDHAHVHIVPRFADDGMKGLPQRDETPQALSKMRGKIVTLI
ncbi:HIT family protein [Candidatus Kaiserbacteria bacterium]|nr:HIT family protein [Candidatus Kaiserbacteria bacterium]